MFFLICMSWNRLEFLGIPSFLGIQFAREYCRKIAGYSKTSIIMFPFEKSTKNEP